MDARIVASFIRRYRRYQLQSALDKIESNASDIYKIDKLTGMRLTKAARAEVSTETITNCFRHTGLLDKNVESVAEEEVAEKDVRRVN